MEPKTTRSCDIVPVPVWCSHSQSVRLSIVGARLGWHGPSCVSMVTGEIWQVAMRPDISFTQTRHLLPTPVSVWGGDVNENLGIIEGASSDRK